MIAQPNHQTVRPNLSSDHLMIDPLSEVLRSVRLTGGIFLDAHFTAPWCVHTQILAEDCGAFPVRPPLLIAYHFVISGKFLLSTEGEPPIEVQSRRDRAVAEERHSHAGQRVRSEAHKRASFDPAVRGRRTGWRISHGGGGETAHLVCGFLGSEESCNPLIATLPRVLKLDVREGVSRDWVEASVRYAASEWTGWPICLLEPDVTEQSSEPSSSVEAMRQYSVTRQHFMPAIARAVSALSGVRLDR